jgi:hypothetical protein
MATRDWRGSHRFFAFLFYLDRKSGLGFVVALISGIQTGGLKMILERC